MTMGLVIPLYDLFFHMSVFFFARASVRRRLSRNEQTNQIYTKCLVCLVMPLCACLSARGDKIKSEKPMMPAGKLVYQKQ
jgi:hypothetical protein